MSKKKTNDEQLVDEASLSKHNIRLVADYDADEVFYVPEADRKERLPLIALRDLTIFPGVVLPIIVGRAKSKEALHYVQESGGYLGVFTQRDPQVEDPTFDDCYPIGTAVSISEISELPTGGITMIVRGEQRIRLNAITSSEPFLEGEVSYLFSELVAPGQETELKAITEIIRDTLVRSFQSNSATAPKGFINAVKALVNPTYIVHLAASLLPISPEERQALLEKDTLLSRAVEVLTLLQTHLQADDLKEEILARTREEMNEQQREYFLQQQMRVIQDELGQGAEDDELETLRKQAQDMHWSKEVAETFEKELRKAERLNPNSPDFAIQMQYLRTILDLPWGIYSQDNFDLQGAAEILEREHYGLEKVKERILEHLAVLKLKGDMKSPILCLYGPPGVGKTSLGRSIAESLGRKYVRISLGGVHDEAEIRGHRRTYIGAMSGRIIQSLQKAKTSNPVFVLDEIDKLSSDYKGDPASALLEVLDPEQNTSFHDNYLDLDYDLSKVLFIATANNIASIPQPLRDRMEMIEVSGYIAEEKLQIAQRHLLPKEAKEHGLELDKINFAPEALELIIEEYTRESGVRALTKKIDAVLRKLAWQLASQQELPALITPELVRSYLGKTVYSRDKYQGNEHPGVVVGLAWTSVGGEILFIESSLQPGQSGKLQLTGSLGDVMKESASIALSYIRAHASELGIDLELLKDKEIHIHVPEGAIPKDGPSAGITMVTSLVSAITRRKVRPHLAMTGEITLRGKVLPVGGIKEKILAAKRSGITDIILCQENERDIEEIDQRYLQGLTFHFVDEINQVLAIALLEEVADQTK